MTLPWLDDLAWRGGLGLLARVLAAFLVVERGKYEDMREVAMQATAGFETCKGEVGSALDLTEARLAAFEAAYTGVLSLSAPLKVIEP